METTNKSMFKPPKPRIFSGKGDDQDAARVDTWIQEMKDFLDLSGIKDENLKVVTMQYFLSETAKDFYSTKRQTATPDKPLRIDEFLTELKQHVVPSTHVNKYWKDWNKVTQTEGGKTKSIKDVGLEIERLAQRLGQTNISTPVRVQKFLDAMHPELRLKVEPAIKKQGENITAWGDVVEQAEQQDAALYEAGRYGAKRQPISNAIQAPFQRNKRPQQNQKPSRPWRQQTNYTNTQRSPRKMPEDEYKRLQKEGKCYFCKKPGHRINDCRKRKQKDYNQPRSQATEPWRCNAQSNAAEVHRPNTTEPHGIMPGDPPTFEALMEAYAAKASIQQGMVSQLTVNGKPANALLDTGTTGANLASAAWAEANNIPTTKLDEQITIKMAAKGSKTMANREAMINVDIGNNHIITTHCLLAPIGKYDLILGIPFLKKAKAILDIANGTARFQDAGITLQYSTNTTEICVAATRIDWNPRTAIIMDDSDDEMPYNVRTATIVDEYARVSAATFYEAPTKLPDFKREFPNVFPDKPPQGLPPLRPGCNHRIQISPNKRDQFRKMYQEVPNAWFPALKAHLKDWQQRGIAEPTEGN